jgi:16S rRNA C967 or C1407 C5-methylase (RsmB/RsmF family)/NOL1/NOP2/fmu family ribosome biogenesis protein
LEGKSVPHELLQSLQKVDGFDENAFVKVHENRNQVVSVRANLKKLKETPQIFQSDEKVPWSNAGYYLPSRPSFTFDPLFHAGSYYVQEASGMFLEQCLKQTLDLKKSLRALDLCAAPGGKSTLIQSLISHGSLLVSNEVIKTRVGVLVENMSKWGGENVFVTNNDARDFSRLENYFDVMVIDAPCSGSGLFRRDPDAIDEWSTDAVRTCSLRQQRILADVYPCLKQNGILIYSTCSYSPEEDEAIGDWLMENFDVESLQIKVDEAWNIIESRSDVKKAFGYRFFPNRLKGEGFYIACYRKRDGESESPQRVKKGKQIKIAASEKDVIKPWLKDDLELIFYRNGEEIFAVPSAFEDDLGVIQSNLYIKKAGVAIGKIVRDELLPAHELALSGLVSDKLFTISLKKDEALQYLRKEEVVIKESHRGWALVQYEKMNLGWVKVLANRTNNYYPKEWRILKSGNV